MVNLIKRVAAPIVRLTSVDDVKHEAVFEAFADHVARVVVNERVRQEPRVVSFRRRSLL